MAEQEKENGEKEEQEKLLEEPAWTGWKGILLKEEGEPEKEPAWTGWRGHVEEKKRGE